MSPDDEAGPPVMSAVATPMQPGPGGVPVAGFDWSSQPLPGGDPESLRRSGRVTKADEVRPGLSVISPLRASWAAGAIQIAGTTTETRSTEVAVSINDALLSQGPPGGFSSSLPAEFGLNVVRTEVEDFGYNTKRDVRAVMSGSQVPYDTSLDRGIFVRLDEGAGGLSAFDSLAAGIAAGIDLNALLSGPVVNERAQTCVFGACVTWYSVVVNVSNPVLGPVSLDIDPRADGTIHAFFRVSDVSLDWSGNATVAYIPFSGGGDITASSVDVELVLRPGVVGDAATVNLEAINVTTQNFDFGFTQWLEDVLGFFGVDLDGIVEGILRDAVRNAANSAIPPLIADVLNQLDLAFQFALAGTTVDITGNLASIDVDDRGFTVNLRTRVTSPGFVPQAYGSLYGGYSAPAGWPGGEGTTIGISMDFVNQLLHTLWGAGLLDVDADPATLGIDLSLLDLVFPGVADKRIVTAAPLPPVVIPGQVALLELQAGGLLVDLAGTQGGAPVTLLSAYASALADVDVDVVGGTSLGAVIADADVYFDVTAPPPTDPSAAFFEVLLDQIVPSLLPTLIDAIGAIDIPSIQGFTVTNATVGTGGPEDGYLMANGDLVPSP